MELKYFDNFAWVKKADDGVISGVASDATEDRAEEKILPSAFEKWLPTYLKNPVILASHTHRAMNGEPTIIGSAKNTRVEKDQLLFDLVFASTPLAKLWKTLYDEGHAKAFSVGFIPHEGKMIDEVWTWIEVELIEISAVPVGSNRNALTESIEENERMNRIAEALYSSESEGDKYKQLWLKRTFDAILKQDIIQILKGINK